MIRLSYMSAEYIFVTIVGIVWFAMVKISVITGLMGSIIVRSKTVVEVKVLFTVTAKSELQVKEDMEVIKYAINNILSGRFNGHPHIGYDGVEEMLMRED